MLIAANCEAGANGCCSDGTFVATEPACGASGDTEASYHVGLVSGREGTAIGCNWTFSPICDLYFNWRNTIVNNRSYGRDVEKVIANAKAFMDGVRKSNMLCCAKHFPGDGSEERDQHLLMGVNDFSCEEWDATYGKAYKALIDYDVESVMVGHIALPSYQKRFNPELRDEDILPATMSKELLTDLLRGKLGFEGIIVTDASHMGGMTGAGTRREQVVKSIAAGCDMFLFFNEPEEDLRYLAEAVADGTICAERLDDALHRILGMKAHLKLHERQAEGVFAQPEANLSYVGCEEHRQMSAAAAKKAVTLVKDTQGLLPIDPAKKKRARLYVIESAPASLNDPESPVKSIIIDELEKAGFVLDVHESYYDMERRESSPANKFKVNRFGSAEEFKKKYDVVFYFVNITGYAQQSNMRVCYSSGHSNEMPWWTHEVPTVCVSLNYTTHLYDLPMMKTFINAYASTREYIHAVVQKIIGAEPFTGTYEDTVWCDRWDTRL
jgi:beta-N-acetylhexosaminidase